MKTIGDKVQLLDDDLHTGTIEAFDGEMTIIRWHRGFSTKEPSYKVVFVNEQEAANAT